jgi:hypothetical protein
VVSTETQGSDLIPANFRAIAPYNY